MSEQRTKVFLSYAHEDLEVAWEVYSDLTEIGIDVWFDKKSLRVGQKWKNAVRAAIKESNYFLALISSRGLNRRGFVHQEMKDALDLIDQVPDSDIFIMPARLDECDPSKAHVKLEELHRIDLFPSYGEGMAEIIRVLQPEEVDIPSLNPDLVILGFGRSAEVEIEFTSPSQSWKSVRVKGVIDTGSAMTIIPLEAVEKLDSSNLIYRRRIVTSVLGEKAELKAYFVNIGIAGAEFHNWEVLAIDRPFAVLGLDLLQSAVVLFDGPKQTVKVWMKRRK